VPSKLNGISSVSLRRLYYTWVEVGTPNTTFLVALDTGSDLFWVPCDCIECAPLSGYRGSLVCALFSNISAALGLDRVEVAQ
jgi:hypothetical protein